MSRPTIDGVVFDLDDTLYPESLYVTSGYRAVASVVANRWPEQSAAVDFFREAQARFDRGETTRVFDVVLSEMGITPSPEDVAALVTAYREHPPTKLRLFDDAERILKFLDGRVPLGIVTDGFLVSQTRKIDALGLRERCRAVVCTDAYGRERWKPHAHCFNIVQESLGLPHARLAYVGDNPAKDFVAPNALGWTTFQVVRPEGVHRKSAVADGGKAAHQLSSLDELAAYFT